MVPCRLLLLRREDFLSEWTKRGLVYRPDLTASIAKDCYMCQLHYLRYNLLIFEVRSRFPCSMHAFPNGKITFGLYFLVHLRNQER